MLTSVVLAAALLPAAILAQSNVVGTATGFASGVTGGGDAAPAEPADVAELISWLEDDTARVILISKTFDFLGTEGTTTADGCRPTSNTCPDNGGQDAINAAGWCSSSYPTVSVTYDNAAIEGINVGSNKSLVGVGDAGVLKGKGLRLVNGASNVIIQNIHITELNPQYIWGGDAITLAGSDMVWIDHCKFSLIGREMITTGYDKAGRVTISNNEFDGVTTNSASCNGEHYWTLLMYGSDDEITLAANYIHDTSGRAPKVGGADGASVTLHAVNNYFKTNDGHNFDIGSGANVLMEGNVFEGCSTPITDTSSSGGGVIFNTPALSDAATCSSYLGRECVLNSLTSSGDFASYTDAKALSDFSSAASIYQAALLDTVASSVTTNAGVGKISSS
ncbi:polysaccharide lyase family 1 protein [Saccharata proteae CBS 121410]|uniref:pectin lyase n=1 Tax=Saccharata proteae CBS 121410 TaxID=1314787 RepID=A0A9P4HTK6_9PEZI|nr:polysaccharide lyase family 1 protein [Saccharata proteae CBS 121410]